jgi:hypothetical protein
MKTGAIVAGILGLLCLIVAVIYFVEPSGSLPSFLPGHAVGSVHKHMKHGVLALGLAVVLFVIAWFQTGPKTAAQG